jgi:hypothetical protein
VGGGLGGFAGGLVGGQFGFGLSLVGTALGTQVDAAVQKLELLGSALSSPVAKFGELADAGFISSSSLEKQIQALIEVGKEAEAAALIQKDLAATYGDLGGAQELATASDELNRSWTELQVAAANLVATPVAQVLNETAEGLRLFASVLEKIKGVIPQQVLDAGTGLLKTGFNLTAGLGGNIVQGIGRFAEQVLAGPSTPPTPIPTQQGGVAPSAEDSSRQLRLQAITAEVQGNEKLTLELNKQNIELEKKAALENAAARGDSLEKQRVAADGYNRELQRVNEQLNRLAITNASAAQRQNAEFAIGADGIQRQIDAQNQLAQVAAGPYKQFLQQKLGIEETTAAAQDQVRILGAQLEELRANGTSVDSAEYVKVLQAQQLAAKQVELARAQGNNALVEAGNTYSEAVKSASLQARDNFDQIAQQAEAAADSLRGALEGSFNLLTPQIQKNLLNDARRDINQAVSAGFFDSRTVAISATTPESILRIAGQARGIDRANEQLASVNTELVNVNSALTAKTNELVQKNWSVNVAVDATTGASSVQLG